MITRAYVVGPPLTDPEQPIAGVSLMLRTLLHLQSAGIREVIFRRCDPPASDPRVTMKVNAADDAPVGPAFVIPLGTVWHPAIGRRLAHASIDDAEVVAVGKDGAAIYAAGNGPLGPLVDTLATDVTLEAVRLPEFVVVPKPPDGKRRVESLLLRTLFKPTDGFVSRHFNRRISLEVTRQLLPTSVTPNQMTTAAMVIGTAGVLVTWPGTYWHVLGGAVLVQTQSILDGCDGEIARLKHLHSAIGEWLDQVFDDLVNIGFLVAIGHALSIGGSWFAPFAWPIAMSTLVLHTLYQIGLYAALWTKGGKRGSVTAIRWKGQGPPKAPPTTTTGKRWFAVKKLFEDAGRRDFFTFFYVPCAIFGVVELAFLWHALIASLSGIATTSQWLLLGGPESASVEDLREAKPGTHGRRPEN